MPTKSARAAAPAIETDHSIDFTDRRIRAYLASVRPFRDVADLGSREPYQSGRSLIERLALNARNTDPPTLRLTPAQCADVAYFIAHSEPLEPATWWQDPEDEPSHLVGFMFVMGALESSLRARGRS